MNKQWALTQEALDSLLAWLAPDRDEAGARYEAIRRRLIKLFACRGYPEAEDLADETINRVTSKLGGVAPGYRGDPALFFYGVAKKVRQEYERARFRAAAPPEAAVGPAVVEQEYECLERCVQGLPPEQRHVVLEYYRGEGRSQIDNRHGLARQLGINLNALRIRVHRIRLALQQCVESCLGASGPA